MDRIVDIGSSATGLNVENEQLVIRLNDNSQVTTPLAEIAALVISNPRVVMTQAVVAGVAASARSLSATGPTCQQP